MPTYQETLKLLNDAYSAGENRQVFNLSEAARALSATQQDSVAVLLRRVLDDNHACGHTTPDTLNAIESALQSQQVASADRGEAVCFRFQLQTGEWSRWLSMEDLTHYGPDGNLVDGPHPDWERVEYAYAATPPSPAESAEGVDGRFPAPIRNPEAWPPNYADGYNDALRLVTEEGFARPAAPSGVSDADARRLHDYPTLLAFYDKHAFGPKLPPSCLCCGHSMQGREVGVSHAELPGIVICLTCRDASHQPQSGRVEGMVLVPAEPTLAMENAWHKHYGNTFRGRYRSMIAAAPTAGGKEADHG